MLLKMCFGRIKQRQCFSADQQKNQNHAGDNQHPPAADGYCCEAIVQLDFAQYLFTHSLHHPNISDIP